MCLQHCYGWRSIVPSRSPLRQRPPAPSTSQAPVVAAVAAVQQPRQTLEVAASPRESKPRQEPALFQGRPARPPGCLEMGREPAYSLAAEQPATSSRRSSAPTPVRPEVLSCIHREQELRKELRLLQRITVSRP